MVSQIKLQEATWEFMDKPANDLFPTQQENTQAEHERLYRDHKKQLDVGQRDYLKHKREQAESTTR